MSAVAVAVGVGRRWADSMPMIVPLSVPGRPGVVGDQREFDFLAACLVEDLAEGWVGAEVDGEAAQRLLDRLLAVVAQRQHLAVRVFDHQALDQVVDVGGLKLEVDSGVAFDLAVAVKVADAAVEEHNLRNRQGVNGLKRQLAVVGRHVRTRLLDGDGFRLSRARIAAPRDDDGRPEGGNQ